LVVVYEHRSSTLLPFLSRFALFFSLLALAVLSSPLVFQKGKIQTDPKRKHTQPNKKPKRGEKNEVKKKKKEERKRKKKKKKREKKSSFYPKGSSTSKTKQNKTKQAKRRNLCLLVVIHFFSQFAFIR
jgi:outer membrane biosynthesis protein TonB